MVAVRGRRLAREMKEVTSPPLPIELSDARALIAGRFFPLQTASDTKLVAQLPLGLAENTRHQVIVARGKTYSAPEPVLVVSANPTLFSTDETGSNQGMVYVFVDGVPVLADESRPAKGGEEVTIRCTGLGGTVPAVGSGEAAPVDPPARVMGEVRVTIAGRDAEVRSAILAPGRVGEYLVTAVVPVDVEATSAAPVIVSTNGIESTPVTIALAGL